MTLFESAPIIEVLKKEVRVKSGEVAFTVQKSENSPGYAIRAYLRGNLKFQTFDVPPQHFKQALQRGFKKLGVSSAVSVVGSFFRGYDDQLLRAASALQPVKVV